MGADSRRKGAAFERSVVSQINEWLESQDINFSCKRNLDQYQQANLADIDIPYHSVECKHYADGWTYKPQVCLPLYAVNTEWPADNRFNCVLGMEEWFEVMARNWPKYERMVSSG